MKNRLLKVGIPVLALAGLVGAGAGVGNNLLARKVNADYTPVGNRTLKLHYDAGGDDVDWTNPLILYYSSERKQYEGTFNFAAGDEFGFQVLNGEEQVNWVSYKSDLGAAFTADKDGDNIEVVTAGVYSIFISGDIESYGGPSDGYWIWQNDKSDIIASATPKIYGAFDGAAWADGADFAWDETSHRYKLTVDLSLGDEFKVKSGDTVKMGYHANLGGTFLYGTANSNNIEVQNTGKYTFYLGSSFNFYEDASYGWVADHASDDSGKNYYFSYFEVDVAPADLKADIDAYAALSGEGKDCEFKYNKVIHAWNNLTAEEKTSFQTTYVDEWETLKMWMNNHDSLGSPSYNVSKNNSSVVPFVVAVTIGFAIVAACAAFIFTRKKEN